MNVGVRAVREARRAALVARDAEWVEQCCVVQVLELAGICFAASLNGVHLTPAQAGRAKAAGMTRGEPDLRIYDPPPLHAGRHSTALEMKRPEARPVTARAHRWSGAEPHQRERLAALEARGWLCLVGYGWVDAVEQLRAAGYPLPEVGG